MDRSDKLGGFCPAWGVTGRTNMAVLASVALSMLIHSVFVSLFLFSVHSKNTAHKEKIVLDLELDSRSIKNRPDRSSQQKPGPQDTDPGQPTTGGQSAQGSGRAFQAVGGPRPEVALPIPVDSPMMREFLAGIKAAIAPLWARAQPPGMGRVELRMEISSRGEVSSLWITRLQGSPELGDFVADLVREAGPFPATDLTQDGPVVVDCSFDIVGGSRAEVR